MRQESHFYQISFESLNPYYTGSYSMSSEATTNISSRKSLNPYYTGSYSMRAFIIIASFSTENNRKYKRVTLKKKKKVLFLKACKDKQYFKERKHKHSKKTVYS